MKPLHYCNPSKRLKLLSLLVCLTIGLLFPDTSVRAELPPRPTQTQPTQTQPKERKVEPALLEGEITLTVDPLTPGLWAVVQWQDNEQSWHDVAGWRGQIVNGKITWWVEEKDFGKDQFRWAVYQGEEGSFLATSQPFSLPTASQLDMSLSLTLSAVQN